MLPAMVYKQVQIEANNYFVGRDIKRIMSTEQSINLIKIQPNITAGLQTYKWPLILVITY